MNEPRQPEVLNDAASQPPPTVERADAWWYRIYFAVIVFTMLVLALLWSFTRYFQS